MHKIKNNGFFLIQQSTQESVENTQLACSSLTMSIEKSCLELIERIRAQEGIYKDQALDLQEQLELEIAILMGQEELMDKLLQTEDHVYFLQVWFCQEVCKSVVLTCRVILWKSMKSIESWVKHIVKWGSNSETVHISIQTSDMTTKLNTIQKLCKSYTWGEEFE